MKTNIDQLKLNRFKPAEYKKENLINFHQPNRWMHAIEGNQNPDVKGFGVFVIFCAIVTAYFIFR